jgi:hypothetical protein
MSCRLDVTTKNIENPTDVKIKEVTVDSPMKPQITVFITDLDNTLWDWFELWFNAFRLFLTELSLVTGLEEHLLKKEIKAVHQRHGTAEYSLLLQSLSAARMGS